MSKEKKGFTLLYIPNKQGKRSVQIHLSYLMSTLLASILLASFVGVFFLVLESTQIPSTEELLAETLELGQNKRAFEEELDGLERRVSLLEIYALQAENEESGGPLAILHQQYEYVLPISPFLRRPIPSAVRIKEYGIVVQHKESHQGIDFFAPKGTLVQASHEGRVAQVGYDPSFGTMIVVEHEEGISSRYAHIEESFVDVGDWVLAQAPLALVGDSGNASGYHLHFELLFQGSPIDPSPYFLQP
jgi:murein DD-endopeptidase MepM/ murein hydrolase activator NlpD